MARKFGKVYYDMGFLSSAEVLECSASDLVGQYVGQTGPKTRDMFDKALGKVCHACHYEFWFLILRIEVLFIDEAYRLCDGAFAKEAIDEIVDCLTKEKYQGRLIVVLAGYEQDINTLLGVNRGLASRIADEIMFYPLSPEKCAELLVGELTTARVAIDYPPGTDGRSQLIEHFVALTSTPQWGNARDIKTLAKRLKNEALLATDPPSRDLRIQFAAVTRCLDDMLNSILSRSQNKMPQPPASPRLPAMPPPIDLPAPPCHSFASTSRTTEVPRPEEGFGSIPHSARKILEDETYDQARDPGVSNDTWAQLTRDKEAAAKREEELRELKEKQRKEREELFGAVRVLKMEMERMKSSLNASEDSEDSARRRAEQLRIDAIAKRAKNAEAEAVLEKRREEAQKEAKVQQKLRQMGVCVAGFRWIKQTGGYRCAGGSHWVSDLQLGV